MHPFSRTVYKMVFLLYLRHSELLTNENKLGILYSKKVLWS